MESCQAGAEQFFLDHRLLWRFSCIAAGWIAHDKKTVRKPWLADGKRGESGGERRLAALETKIQIDVVAAAQDVV
ncbi:MAG: hypothetical protein LBE21_08090, partial [Pseudomonadales bacterium]|nr:hypothetical protein [Pseudomonadales bacterium]